MLNSYPQLEFSARTFFVRYHEKRNPMLGTSERLHLMAEAYHPQPLKSLSEALAELLSEDQKGGKFREAPIAIAYVLGSPTTWTNLTCAKCGTSVRGESGQESYCVKQGGQGCKNEFALKENKRSFEIQVYLKNDDNKKPVEEDQKSEEVQEQTTFYALLKDTAAFQLIGMGASQFADLVKTDPTRATTLLTTKFDKIRKAALTLQIAEDDFTVVIHHFTTL
jgi:hypothetical protein